MNVDEVPQIGADYNTVTAGSHQWLQIDNGIVFKVLHLEGKLHHLVQRHLVRWRQANVVIGRRGRRVLDTALLDGYSVSNQHGFATRGSCFCPKLVPPRRWKYMLNLEYSIGEDGMNVSKVGQ